MDDERRPEYYERHRGDTSLWHEVPSDADVRKGPTVVFSFRLTADELELVREAASERGINVSELVRSAALRDVAGEARTLRVELPWSEPRLSAISYQVRDTETQSFGATILRPVKEPDHSIAGIEDE